MLELFSGTGTLAMAFKELGWETVTLDADKRHCADICCDITEWDCLGIAKFDHIHLSPPCTDWSQAKTRGVREIDGATHVCLTALDKARALLKPGAHFQWRILLLARGLYTNNHS